MTPFAMADMRVPFAAAALFLVLGIWVLVTNRSRKPRAKQGWWLAITALLGGPAIATVFWMLYIFTEQAYMTNKDRFEDLLKFLTLGAIVGVVTASAVVASSLLRRAAATKEHGEKTQG